MLRLPTSLHFTLRTCCACTANQCREKCARPCQWSRLRTPSERGPNVVRPGVTIRITFDHPEEPKPAGGRVLKTKSLPRVLLVPAYSSLVTCLSQLSFKVLPYHAHCLPCARHGHGAAHGRSSGLSGPAGRRAVCGSGAGVLPAAPQLVSGTLFSLFWWLPPKNGPQKGFPFFFVAEQVRLFSFANPGGASFIQTGARHVATAIGS